MFFIGHSSLMFVYSGKVIHIDPDTREADYDMMPEADLILVTHQHADHFDMTAINHILQKDTRVVMTRTCMGQLEDFKATVMRIGDTATIIGVGIEALPVKIGSPSVAMPLPSITASAMAEEKSFMARMASSLPGIT